MCTTSAKRLQLQPFSIASTYDSTKSVLILITADTHVQICSVAAPRLANNEQRQHARPKPGKLEGAFSRFCSWTRSRRRRHWCRDRPCILMRPSPSYAIFPEPTSSHQKKRIVRYVLHQASRLFFEVLKSAFYTASQPSLRSLKRAQDYAYSRLLAKVIARAALAIAPFSSTLSGGWGG
jgi:hypothetical protein